MFDVFYINQPTGLFPHERHARDFNHARQQSRTRFCWILDYLSDYQGFDFLWEPSPWQANQAHAWPSQHQASGGTWLLPKSDCQDVNREHKVVYRTASVPRLHIKHSDTPDQGDINTRYISSYLGTMVRALKKVNWTHCWVTADVCDYANWDFSWHPSEWQQNMLHVFASDQQRFGDTFYVHVPSFLAQAENLKLLEFYDGLNFVNQGVPRLPLPAIQYQEDSAVPAIKDSDYAWPLIQLYRHYQCREVPAVALWQDRTKNITPLTASASTVLVPREAKNFVKSQGYDYPAIDRSHAVLMDPPLDIVFISNGEAEADQNLTKLRDFAAVYCNRIVEISGIDGRVAAYHAAAEASNTPWFFAVFAKLSVTHNFNWFWQPDYLQQPKHYIFQARNPVNGLVYGHQAMIAYNRSLCLANTGRGLDFTLDDPHESVNLLSGVARFNTDPWITWRTAFREVLKLRHDNASIESRYRLRIWLTEAEGEHADWCLQGAKDAVEYYDSVMGDITKLRLSYEWAWLRQYFDLLHKV